MNNDSERQAFEVDLLPEYRARHESGKDIGEYTDIVIEHDWRIWHSAWHAGQARAALVAPQQEPVAEVVSAHGDPEAFGEREINVLVDLRKIPYDTRLYAAPLSPLVETLYQAIRHGDEDHQKWLKEAIDAHFAQAPLPPYVAKTPSQLAELTDEQILYLREQFWLSDNSDDASVDIIPFARCVIAQSRGQP